MKCKNCGKKIVWIKEWDDWYHEMNMLSACVRTYAEPEEEK